MLGAREFSLDASADSLVLEGDEDLRFSREIDERYGGESALFVTYAPEGDLLAEETRARLAELRGELQALPRVSAVTTLLDVPLLRNPPVSLADLESNLKTLEHPEASIELARDELETSPIYRELIVSRDLSATAMQVEFAKDPEHEARFESVQELVRKKLETGLSKDETKELAARRRSYKESRELQQANLHEDIASIRAILDEYRSDAEIHLGGVPMIADDIVSFLQSDIVVFGTGILLLLCATLFWVFRGLRWVVLPLLCCVYSGLAMVGVLGWVGWQVTVVSSNFISLQLIFTLSLAIHIIVRLQEGLRTEPELSYFEQVQEAVRRTFVPCLYASLTTVAGFTSLTLCDILPVVQFGQMMTMGIAVSLVVTFVLFPTGMLALPAVDKAVAASPQRWLTRFLAQVTEKRGGLVLATAGLVAVLTVVGILRLRVENSFIDYFKKSSEIYQGMEFIDRKLGGTTPLDVVLEFGAPEDVAELEEEEVPSEFDEFEEQGEGDDAFGDFDEFEEEDFSEDEFAEFEDDEFGEFEDEASSEPDDTYWYTTTKLERVRQVHDYLDGLDATGKVMSLEVLTEIGRQANDGENLDDLLTAVLYSRLPDEVRAILVTPYASVEHEQARLNVRIKDSLPGLERDALLKQIRRELVEEVGLEEDEFRLTGLMVLYNNMLQSLFQSQASTVGWTLAALLGMFWLLFRSLRIAVIAVLPSLLSSLVVLGVMGLGGIPLDIMTITVVAISTGIAVDDTIHYLHRFEHELQSDGDYVATMHRCHGSIGNAMYFTTIAITLGFSILALSNFVPSILFGLLTALAMVIALVSSLTLLPRLILLLKPFRYEPAQG